MADPVGETRRLEALRPLSGFFAVAGNTDPMLLREKHEIRNVTELAYLTVSRSHARAPMPYLPVALDRMPEVGEVVTGYRFAGLDVSSVGAGDDRPITPYLYRAPGRW